MKLVKPKNLSIGDKVAIVSLSSGILGEPFVEHQLEIGVRRLKEMGLEPVFMPNALKGIDYIKNNPQERAKDLKLAFKDPTIKAIICAIGGDDTFRTIPYLMEDEEFKKMVVENPKIFIGFSDSTNNHLMLNKLGLMTYYGLNFLSDLCEMETDMLEYTKNSYSRLFHNNETFEIVSSTIWYKNRKSYGKEQLNTKLEFYKEERGYKVLFGKDKISGVLWGGCLESIYDIYTSKRYENQREIYEKYDLIPNKDFFKDKILFLETSEEKPNPHDFEEMLNILIKEGVLGNARALLVGKPYDEIYYSEYKEILIRIGSKLELSIMYNLNFGHSLPRAMIPYGVNCEVDFENKTIKIIEKMFE